MQSSHCLSAMLAAVAPFTSACSVAIQTIGNLAVGIYRVARAFIEDGVMAVLAKVGRMELTFDKPRRLLLAAHQYVLRQAKRARPTMTPGWRMCSSV